ncbi:MAG: hypothetical protein WC789_07020 [Lentisphaeria bacterium]
MADSREHPRADWQGQADGPPWHVYCDVLAYADQPGQRWLYLKGVLVAQPGPSGLHRGRMWRPRPSTLNLSGPTAELDQTTAPADLDGDHVLIGFLGDSLDQPVIIASLPHPQVDIGHQTGLAGQRLHLLEADGDPDLTRHHGVTWGVDDQGGWQVDSRRANDGEIDPARGFDEPVPPTDGKGGQTYHLPKDAAFQVILQDMTNPDVPVSKVVIRVDSSGLTVQMEGATLQAAGKDGLATLKVGDGAMHVPIVEALRALYGNLKTYVENALVNTGMGPSSTISAAVGPAPAWDPAIESTKVSLPNG